MLTLVRPRELDEAGGYTRVFVSSTLLPIDGGGGPLSGSSHLVICRTDCPTRNRSATSPRTDHRFNRTSELTDQREKRGAET